MMQSGFEFFSEIFLNDDFIGLIGPMSLVIIGYILFKKDKSIGVLWFVLECIIIAQYIALVDATPFYYWQIFIMVLGGLFTIVFPMMDR